MGLGDIASDKRYLFCRLTELFEEPVSSSVVPSVWFKYIVVTVSTCNLYYLDYTYIYWRI